MVVRVAFRHPLAVNSVFGNLDVAAAPFLTGAILDHDGTGVHHSRRLPR